MDRRIVYSTQIPLSKDFLTIQRNMLRALGQLASDVMTSGGTPSLIVGMACTPSSPAALTVQIAAGSVYQSGQPDNAVPNGGGAAVLTPFGPLTADASSVMLQGISLASQTVSGFAAPGTVGQSINYLVQMQVQSQDGNLQTLNYFNAANPSVPLIGVGGLGAQQPTDRLGAIAIQVIAGTAATTGAQTTPAATTGWIPAYVVTVANGQTTVGSGNIATHASAPMWASHTSQHHKGTPGQAPKIDLTAEVQGSLPLANMVTIPSAQLDDLLCSAGAGLVLNFKAGVVNLAGVPTVVSASNITLTASSTNYVYVNALGAVAFNTTSFASAGLVTPLAQVTTSGSAITAIVDKRGWLSLAPNAPGARRQTVLTGAVDAGGLAAILQIGTGLACNLLATATAVTIAFAAGMGAGGPIDYQATVAADVTSAWSGLTASSTLFLYVDRNTGTGALTYGFTTLAPVYALVAPGSPATGQLWFDLVNMVMKSWSGSAWTVVQRVVVGECVTNGSNVTSVTSYALRGYHDLGWFAVALNTNYTKTHNLGMATHNMEFVNYYSLSGVDTDATPAAHNLNAGHTFDPASTGRTTVRFMFGGTVANLGGANQTTGYYRVVARRNW